MLGVLLPALRLSLVACILCGIAFPIAVTGVGQWLLPLQANGSLLRAPDGTIVGSSLIGQQWSGDEWFHGRPSATTTTDPNDPATTVSAPYNAASSSGSNLGPTSKLLFERLKIDRKALEQAQPDLMGNPLPADALTASGSGLDPDISPAYAVLQVARVAHARGVSLAEINSLLAKHTTGRSLGIFGEPRVNVLALNLALQRAYPPRRELDRRAQAIGIAPTATVPDGSGRSPF
jgi:potassium-transporting ATPase KdpC subunit